VERRTGRLLLALGLAGYGAHRALTAIAMLPSATSPPMLLAFALEAVLAILAAFGVWRERDWAAGAVLGLGLAIALTALIEVLLGVLGWLIALLIAIAAVAAALLLGAWLRRPRPAP
jgi:hypothetical protein